MAANYKDVVIQEFASSEAELAALVYDLREGKARAEADRDTYRLFFKTAVHHIHDMQVADERLQRQLDRLREEYRALLARERGSNVAL
jgi:hypothetical protein